MINIFIIFALLFCIMIFAHYVIKGGKNRLFIYVLTVPSIFYVVNYPLRALILQTRLIESEVITHSFDMYQPLLYSLVFFLALYAAYRINSRNFGASLGEVTRTVDDVFLCNATFVMSVAVFIYRYYNGKLFALYTEETDLYGSFVDNLMGMFSPLKWYCIALCFLLWKSAKDKVRLVQGLVMLSMILFESIVSTAKGPLVFLLILYLFIKSVYKEKVRYFLVGFSIPVILIMAVFSYYVRYYGTVRGDFSLNMLAENIKIVSEMADKEYVMESGLGSVANRLNYLDALSQTMKMRDRIDPGIYAFGSICELLNAVPRFIWQDRPLINFNIFTTREIWGLKEHSSETPIGRIGESYLVIGFFGIIYAVFYGSFFAFIENKLVTGLQTTKLAYYFFILCHYVLPDSHIVFLWFPVVFVTLILITLKYFYGVKSLFSNKRAQIARSIRIT